MMMQASYFVWVGGESNNRLQLLGCVTGEEDIRFLTSQYAFDCLCDAYIVEVQALSRFQSLIVRCGCSVVDYTQC
jgi:hypothetical protein